MHAYLTASLVIVDDSLDDIEITRHSLARSGFAHPLITLLDSAEAIAFFGRAASPQGGVDAPFVCLLDINMPGYDGFEVLRAIRASDALDHVAVVMLSTSNDPRDVGQAAALGAQCYLMKHPRSEVLRNVLHEAERFARATDTVGASYFHLEDNLLRSPGSVVARPSAR